jgi:hypothetical protein
MLIRFRCPNGHKLRANAEMAGKTAACGKCGSRVSVPTPASQKVTDTSILRILGDVIPKADGAAVEPRETAQRMERDCPRCRISFSATLRICPRCKVYLPPTSVRREAI